VIPLLLQDQLFLSTTDFRK